MTKRLKNFISSKLFNLDYAGSGVYNYYRLLTYTVPSKSQIALVTVGRNDDYMPDFYQRMKATLSWNTKYLVSEPIFVEWNPPQDRELLAFRLTKEFPAIKVFVVPGTIHKKVCQNSNLALMEYHAKNVGIRRARSKWIISSNADVAISPKTIRKCLKFTCDNKASEMFIARTAERVDVDWGQRSTGEMNLFDFIAFKKIITTSRYGTGDFLMATNSLWHSIKGYDERLQKHRVGCDVRGAAQMVAHLASMESIGQVLHFAHPTSCTEAGIQPHHGENASLDGIPYINSENWGLTDYTENQIGERVWLLG